MGDASSAQMTTGRPISACKSSKSDDTRDKSYISPLTNFINAMQMRGKFLNMLQARRTTLTGGLSWGMDGWKVEAPI